MDPVHQPLKSVSPKELLSQLKIETVGEGDPELSPEAEANRLQAASELSAIFELANLGSFQWFLAEFINEPFQEARRIFHDSSTPEAGLPEARTRYLTLRNIAAALLEREIMHRELLTPTNTELPLLREKLSLL